LRVFGADSTSPSGVFHLSAGGWVTDLFSCAGHGAEPALTVAVDITPSALGSAPWPASPCTTSGCASVDPSTPSEGSDADSHAQHMPAVCSAKPSQSSEPESPAERTLYPAHPAPSPFPPRADTAVDGPSRMGGPDDQVGPEFSSGVTAFAAPLPLARTASTSFRDSSHGVPSQVPPWHIPNGLTIVKV
jgi:hypothetical protein